MAEEITDKEPTAENFAFAILELMPLPFMLPADVIELQSKIEAILKQYGDQQLLKGRTEIMEGIHDLIIKKHKEEFGWLKKDGEERDAYFIAGFIASSLTDYINSLK